MTGPEVMDIGREALMLVVKMSAIPMLAVLIVGVAVSIFQALTQVQENTLAFAPKILAMFLALALSLPLMGQSLTLFSESLTKKIQKNP